MLVLLNLLSVVNNLTGRGTGDGVVAVGRLVIVGCGLDYGPLRDGAAHACLTICLHNRRMARQTRGLCGAVRTEGERPP